MPCARRNWIASSEAWRRTASQGVPSANWSEMAPIRPVWMLMESVIADRIGPDQYEVCELIGIGRMWRLWLPRQSLFFFQAEDGIRDLTVTGVQTCALPI